MNRLVILLLSVLLSGCATMASSPPKVSEIAYKDALKIPAPSAGNNVLSVYNFADNKQQNKHRITRQNKKLIKEKKKKKEKEK